MKVLLDTNIIVDILSKREGYMDSLQVLRLCEVKKLDGFITTTTVTDLMYILRKHCSPEQLRESVQTLLTIIGLSGIQKADINRAFASSMKNFEDAVQAACAKRLKADYVVTKNLRDFAESPVPAISPADMIKRISGM